MKTMTWMMAAVFFTSSFDVILVLNVGGTLRFAQIVMVFVMLAAIGHIIQTKRILWPRGQNALVLWCVLQAIFIGNSEAVLFSVQLYILLLLAVLGNLAILQLYGRSAHFPLLFKRYLQSFVFVAGCGLVQLVSPALHLGAPFVRQWIVHGLFPRISAFNYEPSYFATYLTIGWVLLVDLRASKAQITLARKWFWYTLMVSAVLFFSTSKTAWAAMLLEGLFRVFPYARRYVMGQVIRLRDGNVSTPLPRLRALAVIGMILVGIAASLSAVSRIVDPRIFLSGSGIAGAPAHSVIDRTNRFKQTWTIAKAHPWVGLSLGGVAPQVAIISGTHLVTLADAKNYWGYPVIVDTLAASGVPGFLPFVWYFLVIMVGESKIVREKWHDERAKWLHAMIRALALEWFVLLSDQFLIRMYLWIHIGMVVVVAYNLRHVPATALEPEMEERLVAA